MKYHIVVNGHPKDRHIFLKEQNEFCQRFLAGDDKGETFVLCSDRNQVAKIQEDLSGDTVLLTEQAYSPESILQSLCPLLNPEELYIFGSDYAGMELAVRAGARASGSSVVGAHSITQGNETMVRVKKMVYANHMEADFLMRKGPYCISVAKGSQPLHCKANGSNAQNRNAKVTVVEVSIVNEEVCCDRSSFIVSEEFEANAVEKGLEYASIVIAAGRGAGNKEAVDNLCMVAEALGGQLGVSRPAAMNAWAPMSRLIGVSGAMINPDLCITAGISGASAFYAGIDKSDFIVAINTDEKAPIMKKANVAVVDDFAPVLDELKRIAVE